MKLFIVTYDGSYLGGTAVVVANSPEDALKMVSEDPKTINFNNTTVEQVKPTGVIYNNNGDY